MDYRSLFLHYRRLRLAKAGASAIRVSPATWFMNASTGAIGGEDGSFRAC